jgi:hypothetical protein
VSYLNQDCELLRAYCDGDKVRVRACVRVRVRVRACVRACLFRMRASCKVWAGVPRRAGHAAAAAAAAAQVLADLRVVASGRLLQRIPDHMLK